MEEIDVIMEEMAKSRFCINVFLQFVVKGY